ncbi:hypothetical protein AVEN_217740-1 [Araneus ventricosus]|uniref:Mos1 transposase HTH domain-containing protein n=1 Tax=Araneus ventricosus TaxID=182803 RepID=A0A4Y2NAN7_ARAVE|nr:hypothetical protein AVEN_8601-1 [Araneus ventricosus]GBN36013.1 hypothetical protein AVEN_217740-1 [Araneus ventricosus]
MCLPIDGLVVFPVAPAWLMASHQYPHFWRVVSAVCCMTDSSRSAHKAVIQFLRAEGEHASQIYRRMKEMYGEQCLPRCTIFRRCQHYEARRVKIKDLPRTGQAYVVINNATISAVDELIRQNRRIITREISVELSISKGTVHHIIHKKLGYGKVCAQWVPKQRQRIRRLREWMLALPSSFYTEAIHSLPTRCY